MSQNFDPFATVGDAPVSPGFALPTPGIRPGGPSALSVSRAREAASDIAYQPSGLSPLSAAANPLLNLMAQMRHLTQVADTAALKDNLASGIKQFEQAARAIGTANEKVIAARYILCTALDETAASTPWGGNGVWARNSLLVLFHNETWGGEKVYQLLTRLIQTPAENLDLLELIYACIALGFQGRYRVMQNGATELAVLKERLSQLVRRQRGEYDRQLSLNWAPAAVKRNRWLSAMPLWIFCAITALVMLLVYMTLSFLLNRQSDPLFASITGIRATGPQLKPAVPATKPRLAQFLAPEIAQGLVEVRDFEDRSIVTISGDGLFDAGSAALRPEREPLMLRIADAVAALPGIVLVTGHTDNQPITSARFPSNWHLSQERARSVSGILSKKVIQPGRLQPEGRADSEPVVPNDSAQGRAKNRRVEITLFVSKTV